MSGSEAKAVPLLATDLHGIELPAKPPRTALYVTTIDLFSMTPWNQRTDKYLVSRNRRRSHWILWLAYIDEMDMKWAYLPYALMPCRGVEAKRAAIEMLRAAWAAEHASASLDRTFEAVVNDGLLTVAELKAIAASVWAKSENGSER